MVHAPEALLTVRKLLSWRLFGSARQQLYPLIRYRHPLYITLKDWYAHMWLQEATGLRWALVAHYLYTISMTSAYAELRFACEPRACNVSRDGVLRSLV